MLAAKRLIAIGDIHGCLDKITALMTRIGPTDKDTFVFLGDYINRGTDSKGVIDFLLDFKKRFHSIFLLGNHEKMLLDYIINNNQTFILNGGNITLVTYTCEGRLEIPGDHMEFFKELLPYYESENHIFVHAGLRPAVSLPDQSIHDLIWIREEFLLSDFDWGKIIVHGHTPSRMPVILKRRICLDSGCGYLLQEGYGHISGCDVIRNIFWTE